MCVATQVEDIHRNMMLNVDILALRVVRVFSIDYDYGRRRLAYTISWQK